MKIINKGQGAGKTYDLVQILKADPGAVMVVATEGMRAYLTDQYRLKSNQIVAATTPNARIQVRQATMVLVDEFELVLKVLLGAQSIDVVTASADRLDVSLGAPFESAYGVQIAAHRASMDNAKVMEIQD